MSTNFLMPLMMLVGPEGDQARYPLPYTCDAQKHRVPSLGGLG